MDRKPSKSIMRSLGEAVGHVWRGIAGDTAPKKKVLKREVAEETRQTQDGPVVLRRTTIEEIELPPPKQ